MLPYGDGDNNDVDDDVDDDDKTFIATNEKSGDVGYMDDCDMTFSNQIGRRTRSARKWFLLVRLRDQVAPDKRQRSSVIDYRCL